MIIFTFNSTWLTFFSWTQKSYLPPLIVRTIIVPLTFLSIFFCLLSSCIADRTFDCKGTRNICKKKNSRAFQSRDRDTGEDINCSLSLSLFTCPVTDGRRGRVLRSICSVSLKLLSHWVTPEGNSSCFAQRTPSVHSTLSYSPFHRCATFNVGLFLSIIHFISTQSDDTSLFLQLAVSSLVAARRRQQQRARKKEKKKKTTAERDV